MKIKDLQMKRVWHVALLVLLSAVGMKSGFAQSFTVGDLNYSVNSDGVSVTLTGHVNGTSATGTLTIPETVTYEEMVYPVTVIGDWAFHNCTNLTGSLNIPNSVTTIDNGAFSNCSRLLGSLTIPNSVTTIGNSAFYGCSGLTGSLNIGNSVTMIVSGAFSGCSGLEQIVVASDNSVYDSRENCNAIIKTSTNELVTGCKNTFIPNSVTAIGIFAFQNCKGLTGSLTIPNSVTTIGSSAFAYCNGLTGSLTIPNSVTTIGGSAFYDCSGFTGSLIIPNSVTTIGNSAFYGCSGFTGSLTIGNSVTTIDNGAFSGCSGLEQIVVTSDNSVYDSRESCNAIIKTSTNELVTGCKSTVIPNSVTTIGNGAFWGCSGLTGSLTIPNSVTTIGDYAFYDCTSLTGLLNIPNFVTTIGRYAFFGCSGFTCITSLAETPPTLSNNVFSLSSSIPLFVPCGSEETYAAASWGGFTHFEGLCGGTVTVTADPVEGGTVTGTGVYEAGQMCTVTAMANEGYVFANWTYNGSIVSNKATYSFYVAEGMMVAHFVFVPEGAEGIIEFADANVKAICVANWDTNGDGELSYGEAALVTDIGQVFRNNTEITSFEELQYFRGLTEIGDGAFYNCTNLKGSLIIPNPVTRIGNSAFNGCSGFTGSLTIPNSVTTIGFMAFYGCTNFLSIATHAETPPTLGFFSFGNGNSSIPVNVPCGFEEAYSSLSWGGFSTFLGMCGGTVTVSVNSEGYGTTTSGGMFEAGQTCTVTAEANEGYFFAEWTINGTRVSIDAEYTFCVVGDVDLVAHFMADGIIEFADANVKDICVTQWDINGDGELSYEEAASVTTLGTNFRNNTVISSFDELQYFIGLSSICDNAFQSCIGLVSFVLPNSITKIGNYAFQNCSGLTGSLTIPNSVTTIGSCAFEGCNSFTGSLTIPNSVTTIGNSAFYGCSGFTGNLIIGNSVTTIVNDAFYGCSELTSVTIPNSVTSIGYLAFQYCRGLTSVYYTGDIAQWCCISFSDGGNPLEYAQNLYIDNVLVTDLVIPDNVTEIKRFAFRGAKCLTSLTIPNSVTSINYSAFHNCTGLTGSLTIPNSVTTIGDGAFSGCSGFTGSLTIPNSVTTIGDGAFSRCSGFTGSLTIGNSVTTIGDYAFHSCSGFTGSLTIGNSVTTIGDYAFENCSYLTSLTIPNSVTTIGAYAFANCYRFTGELIIPNTVITIGKSAFHGCSGFMYVEFNAINCADVTLDPDTNSGPFKDCGGTLIIGGYVQRIPANIFYGCNKFTGSLTIPNSVISIGSSAFSGCRHFLTLTIRGETPPTFDSLSFGNWNSSIPVYVPCGFEETYSSMSWGGFASFMGMCGGMVTASADPEGYGTTAGGGMFEAGQTCTVTAEANVGYFFTNWTHNGIIVSKNSEYTFYVAGDMNLVAHFTSDASVLSIVFNDANVKAICVANWDTDDDGELSYAEAASVTDLDAMFKNNKTITFFNELKYFTGLTSIGSSVFEYSSLTTIELPNSVSSIEDWAFHSCRLTSINIPNSVISIGRYAFYYCRSLTSIDIPNSVIAIGSFAFAESGLTSVEIPSSVEYMGAAYPPFGEANPFEGCDLDQISVDTENRVFDSRNNCNAVIWTSMNVLITGCKNTIIPNSVNYIDQWAFGQCEGLTTIKIPNSVSYIGPCAFNSCHGLVSIEIPNAVSFIDEAAFNGCSGLTSMTILANNPPFLVNNGFNSFPIYVPYESLNAYKTATNWSSYEDRIFPMAYTSVPGYGEGEGNYRFIASPLVENTAPTMVDNMITETDYDLYQFNQSATGGEWQNYKANTEDFVLANGQGYLYANADEVNLVFKGEFNEEETKEVNLVYDANAHYSGWNLVGNPFPVAAYANRSYYNLNAEGTAIEPNMASSATQIPACTGIMVKAEGENEKVTFGKTAPIEQSNQGNLQISVARANTRGLAAEDKAIVSFNEDDRLEKFVFNKDNASLCIPQGGKEYAIACVGRDVAHDVSAELPLNFKATKNGEYTLSVSMENVELGYLHLIDNLTGTDIDLLSTLDVIAGEDPQSYVHTYTFRAKTTDYDCRFRLVFNANETGSPSTSSGTFAFFNNGGNLTIFGIEGEATLQVVDVLGHMLSSEQFSGSYESKLNVAPGVYMLRLINGNDVKVQKIVVK